MEISEKLETYHLIRKISAMLSVKEERIHLYHTGDGDVTHEPLIILASI